MTLSAILAAQHRLALPVVIAIAAAAAIAGDNIGYLIGQRGGRWLLLRPGPFRRRRARVLAFGEPFFARHGSSAVFLGRWVLGLRTWAAWLAGASHMPWRDFALWNAAGGISWALTLGLIAYFLGHSAAASGALFAGAGIIGALIIPILWIIRSHESHSRQHTPISPPSPPVADPDPQPRHPATRYVANDSSPDRRCSAP